MLSAKCKQAQYSDPRTLGRGRYWAWVSGRRWDRGADARREDWHRHVDGHPPWKKGAEKDAGCAYCRAVAK